ncbi:hypothetical protein LSTR_LSTR004887 [Laodelphax striatellus]|uniref:GRIP domain-containing protein n=1 Tax=Laodelphax striatellus TaxID=195883 RepID=A0A482XP49_LAOST|nr:hypothetical protein LSTR_LSTR004887 [Laodelphax striatellus]
MFKKLKDKIAEEVKQSPLKSVQQLASAVVSPSSSSVFEPSSNDHFCIDDDDEENQDTPKNSPARAGGFTTVNLHGQTTAASPLDASFSHDVSSRSRKSSISSVASDVSSFFPRYEPSSNSFHLQSDLESASEVEDSLNVQLERVSKENLYEAYRKLRMRYNKYKGRFVDLAEHYRRLEKENTKCKNILLDTQDKALRRFSELREQCALEQEAKAHLEEALRSDLEEKDHLIRTLNTKIELLKKADDVEKSTPETKNLMDFSNSSSEENKFQEDRIKNLELMLEESKASILEKNEIIGNHQNELASIKNLYSQKLSSITKDLNDAKEQIEQLQNTVSSMKKNEEESALSLAENKLTVHRELEMRDEQLKRYKTSVEDLSQQNDDLNNKVNQLQNELSALNGSNRVIDEEKTDLQELSRGKSEAVKLMQQKLVSNEKAYNERLSSKESEINRLIIENNDLVEKVRKFEEHRCQADGDSRPGELPEETFKLQNRIQKLEKELQMALAEKDKLFGRISECEKEIQKLEEDKNSILEAKKVEIESIQAYSDLQKTENEKLTNTIKSLGDEMESLRRTNEKALSSSKSSQDSQLNEYKSLCSKKDDEITNLNKDIKKLENELIESQEAKERLQNQLSSKVEELNTKDSSFESQKKAIETFQTEIRELNNKISNIEELYNESRKEKAILEHRLSSEDVLRAEIIEKLNEDKSYVEKQLKDSENRIVRLENDLKSTELKLKEKHIQNDNLHTKLKDLEVRIKCLDEEIIKQRQKLEEYSNLDLELQNLRKLITTFKSLLNSSKEVDNGSNRNEILDNHKSVISKIQEEGKTLIGDLKSLQSNLNEKEGLIEKLNSEIDESKRKVNNLLSQLSQNHVNSFGKEELLKHLLVNRNILKAMKVDYNELVSKTKSELETVSHSLQFVSGKFPSIQSQVTELEELNTKRVEELKQELSNSAKLHEEQKVALNERIRNLESDILVSRGSCQELKNELEVKSKEFCILEGKLESLQVILEQKSKENVELKNFIADFEQKKDSSSQTLSECKVKIDQLECELLDKNNQLTTLLNQAKLNEENINECQTLKNSLSSLENELSNMKIKFDRELASKDQIFSMKESEFEEIKNSMEGKLAQQMSLLKDKECVIDKLSSDLNKLKDKITSELLHIDSEQEFLMWEKEDSLSFEKKSDAAPEKEDMLHVLPVNSQDLQNDVSRLLRTTKQNIKTFLHIKSNVVNLNSELEALIRKYFKNKDGPNSCLKEEPFEGFSKSFSNLFSKVNILSSVLSTQEEAIVRLESSSGQLTSKTSELETECESLKGENSKLAAEIDTIKQNLNKGSVSNTVKLSNVTSQLESARQEYIELQATHNRKCEEMSNLSKELNSLRGEYVRIREQLEMKGDDNNELAKLRAENEDLKLRVESIEEDRDKNLKQLILEFNTKIAEKDEEVRAAELKKFDRKEAEDNFLFVELKQQIKDLNSQLESSCESYEAKLADNERSKEELEKSMEEMKNIHEKQMREQDKKWRACLDRRLLEAEKKYKEEIDELSKEWQNERKQSESRNTEQPQPQELEHSSRLAVAAMESGASSSELLRKQVTSLTKQLEDTKLQHKHEVSELQKCIAMKKHSSDKHNDVSIEDCTEMEYLRNILFEYMMGKEPVIMAKVLSAIVKFDPEQTNKILQKEEQKVSLLRKVVHHCWQYRVNRLLALQKTSKLGPIHIPL